MPASEDGSALALLLPHPVNEMIFPAVLFQRQGTYVVTGEDTHGVIGEETVEQRPVILVEFTPLSDASITESFSIDALTGLVLSREAITKKNGEISMWCEYTISALQLDPQFAPRTRSRWKSPPPSSSRAVRSGPRRTGSRHRCVNSLPNHCLFLVDRAIFLPIHPWRSEWVIRCLFQFVLCLFLHLISSLELSQNGRQTTGPGDVYPNSSCKKEEITIMKLSEPKVITFSIAVLLGLIGLVAYFIPAMTIYAFWLVLVGLVVLVLGNFLKGL